MARMTDTWDPTTYLRFAGERERPFWELVARVPLEAPRDVVDLGCGPGTATAGLLQRWPQARIVGVDSSPAMVDQAEARAVPGRLSFELADVEHWQPDGDLDVVLSNATLHWVPGHLDLFERWLSWLRPHGVLAFQVPGNFDAPSHQLLAELVSSPPWRERLAIAGEPRHVHPPEEYLRRLRSLGASVDCWETTCYQLLTGPDPVLEWTRGTALRPYLAALSEDEAAAFCADYATRLRQAYPPETTGETVFPFRRVFVVATRS